MLCRILLLTCLLVARIQADSICEDKSIYCRYVKDLCNNTGHREMLLNTCAKTCNFCSKDPLPRTTAINPNDIILSSANRASEKKINCSSTEPRRCVFPDGKKLTTQSPTTETLAESTTPVVIPYEASETGRRTISSPSPDDVLKKFASSKRALEATSVTPTETSTAAPIKPSAGTPEINVTVSFEIPHEYHNKTQEYRKFKLEELMSQSDLRMPRLTKVAKNEIAVSLSKTLIKDTCFDEYIYCREFGALCVHPAFNDIMAAHCTLTCERCGDVDQAFDKLEKDDCEDLTDCEQYKDACTNPVYRTLTEEFCPKTCGYCKPKCRDRHQSCQQYADDGFCTDNTYTKDEIKFLCGKTCDMCS